MYRDKKVIAFTPYGRERTSTLLSIYLAREHQRGIVDEWWLCMNTDEHQTTDVDWAYNVAAILPWVKIVKRPCAGHERCPTPDPMCERRCERYEGDRANWGDGPRRPKQMNTGRFYSKMQDPDAVFVRFDDDVIWLHSHAVENLIDALMDQRDAKGQPPFVAFPVIWNNAVSSFYLQRHQHFPATWRKVRADAVDPVGWGDPRFAADVHDLLLHHLDHDHEDACLTNDPMWLQPDQRFSVSCFAIQGAEYCADDVRGVLTWDEEEWWHTGHRPGEIGRQNVVTGMSQVSHYTFFTQSDYLRLKRPDILASYIALAETVKAKVDAEEYAPA